MRAGSAAAASWGACDALATPRPLGPLHDAVAAVARRSARRRRASQRCDRGAAVAFRGGPSIPQTEAGAKAVRSVVETNAKDGVARVHSYVSPDRQKTFCVYDAPSPEAVRTVAERNKLPVDRITEVSVLAPSFYRAA